MKYLLDSRNKKAISVIVSYVILIGITISLSALVFSWLRFYVGESNGEMQACPESISLIIAEANCISNYGGSLNITIQNNGRYHVDGFIIRVNNRAGAKSGFYSLDPEESILIGAQYKENIKFSKFGTGITTLRFVEVQPYLQEGLNKNYCNGGDSFAIECST
jgi:hypothetical protein